MSFRSTIRIDADGTSHSVQLDALFPGEPLSVQLRRAGWPLNTRCGERGRCRGCLVELVRGGLICRSTGQVYEAEADEAGSLEADSHEQPARAPQVRACDHALIDGQAVHLRLPPRSLLTHRPQVVTSFRLEVPWAAQPLVDAPAETRAGSSEQQPAPTYGAAIDVGTTTVVVVLVDLTTGRIVAEASALNAQIALGDNVLTRIERCQREAAATGRLQQLLVERTLVPLLRRVCQQAGTIAAALHGCVVAGNTTMLHLLAGIDPSPLGVAPFTPVFRDARRLTAHDLGIPSELAAADTTWHLLPSAGAYVGADVIAGALATGLVYADRPRLLLDLGTNGEMILKHGERLWGCATAAGPAFEGEGLTCGMRATDGAIAHLRLTSSAPGALPSVEVIGSRPPIGLCGTAYLDFLAQGRRTGILSPTGRFALPPPLADQTTYANAGRAWLVATGPHGQPLVITERDLAALLQAKAAIAAGMSCLLRRAGLRPADLERVDVAGGFGFHLAIDSLLGAGLLPGVEPEQVHLVGNAALGGAFAALMDRSFADEMETWAARVELIELNLEPDFESLYIDQLTLD